jgi:hypothetical protein
MEAPFVPSLFVEIRKRMGQTVFDVFHDAVIDARDHRRKKTIAPRDQAVATVSAPQPVPHRAAAGIWCESRCESDG